MAKQDTEWAAPLPHDPMERLADNLWIVDGDLSWMPMRRRMVVVRLSDGGLLIHNGVALNPEGMAELEALGPPRYLVVPSAFHRIDAARYKARYPDLCVLAPAGARAAVEKKVGVDATFDAVPEALALDPAVEVFHAAGTRDREGVFVVRSADGDTVVVNDLIFNMPHQKGLFWFVYGRLMGNSGRAKVTTMERLIVVNDKAACAAQLEALAERPGLRRVIVAHGDVVTEDAAGVLRTVAAAL